MTCSTCCLPWVLLTSYAALFITGLFGGYIGLSNFGLPEPTPPPTPAPLRSDDYNPKDVNAYTELSLRFSDAMNDERFYVVVPSVLAVLVSALVILRGLCSRTFFTYTFTLFTTLGMWVLTLVWIILYQTEIGWSSNFSLQSASIIMAILVILMLVLSVQVLLCVGVLRLLKADWPTLNWRNLFTAEAVLVVTRITVTVYTSMSLFSSQLLNGFRYRYDGPSERFPLEATLVCVCAVCYNAIAIGENALSMLLGKMDNCMTTLTTLLSTLLSVSLAIIASPVVIRSLMGQSVSYLYLDTMYLSIGLCVATFLHLVSCIGFATSSRTPPQFLLKLSNMLVSGVQSLDKGQFFNPSRPSNIRDQKALIINVISSVFCVISIITIVAGWDSPLYRVWGSVLMLCANSAILVRTLPPIITDLKFKCADVTPVSQRVIAMGLECVALLVGGMATCIRGYYPMEKFSGAINILFIGFQVFVMVQLVKSNFGMGASGENTVQLSDTEEEQLDGKNEEEEEEHHKGCKPGDVMA